jgi:Flp pilus assembly protein TadD
MPLQFDQMLAQAQAAVDRADWESALTWLTQAKAIDPAHAGALTGMGTCLLQLGRPAEAVALFHEVTGLASDSPEAYNNLGVAYAVTQDWKAAELAYRRALEIDSEHAQAWTNLAQVYLQQPGRLVEGIQILAAVVQACPGEIPALFLLAHCYEEAGEKNSAMELYRRILQVQPDNTQAKTAMQRLDEAGRDPTRIARPEHADKLSALKKRPS